MNDTSGIAQAPRSFQQMADEAMQIRRDRLNAGLDVLDCDFEVSADELKLMGKRAFGSTGSADDYTEYLQRLCGLRLRVKK